jgi:diguanylate cyclase (GGDEF)-like protein
MAGLDTEPIDSVPTADLVALSRRAGDVHITVNADGVCLWSSDGSVHPGTLLANAFAAADAATVAVLLEADPVGPVLARVRVDDDAGRWVGVLATPRGDGGGWTLQLRDAHQLDPTAVPAVASIDVAAGVTDREKVLNEVAWLLSATPRTGKEIAVASCDLDDFEFLNEDYGREAGDEVLRIVTGRISDALRSGDLVARLEDDQLLVVLRGVHHLRGAIRVANKIRAAVEDPIALPAGEIVQTISIGVTLISRGESVDSVLERAEGAMSLAKDAGRNIVMSSPPI